MNKKIVLKEIRVITSGVIITCLLQLVLKLNLDLFYSVLICIITMLAIPTVITNKLLKMKSKTILVFVIALSGIIGYYIVNGKGTAIRNYVITILVIIIASIVKQKKR